MVGFSTREKEETHFLTLAKNMLVLQRLGNSLASCRKLNL